MRSSRKKFRNFVSRFETLERRELMTVTVTGQNITAAGDLDFASISGSLVPVGGYWPVAGDQFTVSVGSEMNVLEPSPPNYGDSFKLLSVTAAKNGVVTINSEGNFVYTPDSAFEGTDSFTYEIEYDSEPQSALLWRPKTQHFHATVQVVHPFVAVPDWTYVQAGNQTQIDVLSNDQWNDLKQARSELESPELWITSVSGCAHDGSLSIAEDGKSLLYSPAEGFEGLEDFTYTVVDEHGNERTAGVQVRVGAEAYDPSVETTFRWEEEYVHHLITSELERAIETSPSSDRPYYFGRGTDILWGNLGTVTSIDSSPPSAVSLSNQTSGTFFSDTNVQVDGVDESDLIENDGEFIYWLSNRMSDDGQFYGREYELSILNAAAPEEAGVLSRVGFEDEPKAMFLRGDRLTVITHSYQNGVTVTVLDVSDREQPTVVETNQLAGQLDDARMIDGRLYLFVNGITARYPSIGYQQYSWGLDIGWNWQPNTLHSQLERLKQTRWLPHIVSQTSSRDVASRSLIDVTNIKRDELNANFTSAILTFDTTDDVAGATSTHALDFTPEAIYMDTDSIYLTSTVTQRMSHWGLGRTIKTEIFAYALSDSGLQINPVASGIVSGRIANQFAMDEYNGQLRVATNYAGGSSAVYVLEADGTNLNLVGGLAGLAPTQRLYSTRFVGDRAYLVTYRKVDPLHVIDLSDPSSPIELGQLEIPGFSDYLHPISENLIIGLGRHAELGLFQELQVSLFDVSDPYNPKRIHNYLIDGARSTRFLGKGNPWGIGDLDHHSFSYFPDIGLLALPLYSEATSSWAWNWSNSSIRQRPLYQGNASGVHLLSIDAENGINLEGEIKFDDRVKRSIKIGDAIYALSDTTVKAVNVSDPSTVVANFAVTDGPDATLQVTTPVVDEVDSCHQAVIDTYSPDEPEATTLGGPLQGDVNEDGEVNNADVDYVFANLGETDSTADLNEDGTVTEADVDYLLEKILKTTRFDLNLDGDVGLDDLEILIENVGKESASWSDGDLTGDGKVGFEDGLQLLSSLF